MSEPKTLSEAIARYFPDGVRVAAVSEKDSLYEISLAERKLAVIICGDIPATLRRILASEDGYISPEDIVVLLTEKDGSDSLETFLGDEKVDVLQQIEAMFRRPQPVLFSEEHSLRAIMRRTAVLLEYTPLIESECFHHQLNGQPKGPSKAQRGSHKHSQKPRTGGYK